MAAGDIIVVNENSFAKKANMYDGTDDYMLADAHAVARAAADDTVGTYTAWIWLDNVAGTKTILSAGDNSSANEVLSFDAETNKLQVFLKHGGVNKFLITETTGSLTAKTWTHVAVVQNGTRCNLYVNGKKIVATDTISTDLTFWYDELTQVDKFAIGVRETNATHLNDFKGAIGQVKYWSLALTESEILEDMHNRTISQDSGRVTQLDAALQLNFTMENDGTTDSGLGADDGTLSGHAYYGNYVSNWSKAIERNVTGHAAEKLNSFPIADRVQTIIKRGD